MEDVGETYARKRMRELGIPENQIGQPDYGGDGRLCAFDPHERQGGKNTTGAVVDSGVLNLDLLKGGKGGRIWPCMRLKGRIDAIIAHEYEELRHGGSHAAAFKAASKTELPISDEASPFVPGDGKVRAQQFSFTLEPQLGYVVHAFISPGEAVTGDHQPGVRQLAVGFAVRVHVHRSPPLQVQAEQG